MTTTALVGQIAVQTTNSTIDGLSEVREEIAGCLQITR
jgi:hypothetical protein